MRMWRSYKQANRSFPHLSDDPVIDFMVIEALTVKDWKLEEQVRKQAEIDEWKKDTKGLEERLATAQ